MNHNATSVIPMETETSAAPETSVQTARVGAVSAGTVQVVLGGKTLEARKAFSCLVDPAPDDTVLCCRDDTGKIYILAIVDRPDKGKMKLSFPSDVTLESLHGNLNMFSGKSVNMSADNLNIFSKKTVHKSDAAYFSCDRVAADGSELQASFKTVRLVSNLINTMARQVIDKFRGYIRHTEDHDQVQAGQLTRRTDGLYSMDSKNTVMISKKETRIDGEKIYMA